MIKLSSSLPRFPSGFVSSLTQIPIPQVTLAICTLSGLTFYQPIRNLALTVCRDEHFHWVTERPNSPSGDGGNPHCARGIVDLNRNLSTAAILANFFRQLFLGIEKEGRGMKY